MELDIINYDLLHLPDTTTLHKIETALLHKGIIGIQNVPEFANISKRYIEAARKFSYLDEIIKRQYTPDRDAGYTEGYELGAEWFKDKNGEWQADDKKASYYAFVPDQHRNKWPKEIELKTPYLELGQLIFNTGKLLLHAIGLNETLGLRHENLIGYGRMLHYHKENRMTQDKPNWCGAHTDHGVFTGLIPAYYFQNSKVVDEPKEAGLYIVPSHGNSFEKITVSEKSIMLFQVGEFGQLISNDRIKATKHLVKKADSEIERFTFALFFSAEDNVIIKSNSILKQDPRYLQQQKQDGSISYKSWETASYAQYRVR